jgi:hypothetical protein
MVVKVRALLQQQLLVRQTRAVVVAVVMEALQLVVRLAVQA